MVPLILLGLAVASAGVGIIEGLEAHEKFELAKRKVKNAERKLNKAINELEREREVFNTKAKEVSLLFKESYEHLYRFSNLIEKLGVKVNISKREKRELRKLTIKVKEVKVNLDNLRSDDILEIFGKAVIAGCASSIGTVSLGTAIGTASTGTAISTLSGAAFENALLAWLGGGAISAGGGGIALGTIVLGGMAIGPAIGIAGITLSMKAEKALTQAMEYEEKVEKKIAKLKVYTEKLKTINRKVEEGIKVRKKLLRKFKEKLYAMEKGKYDEKDLRTLISMAKTLKKIFDEPIIRKEDLV